jgi:hypothetical protein
MSAGPARRRARYEWVIFAGPGEAQVVLHLQDVAYVAQVLQG